MTKKLLSLLIGLMMLAALTACGAKEQSVTLFIEDAGVLMEYEMKATGDRVHTITQTTTLDISSYTEDEVAQIQASMETYKLSYETIEGTTYNMEFTEEECLETITIDATNEETLSALAEQGLMPIEGDGDYSISLSKTAESLKEQGWEERE